jgi:hypothetical protein
VRDQIDVVIHSVSTRLFNELGDIVSSSRSEIVRSIKLDTAALL